MIERVSIRRGAKSDIPALQRVRSSVRENALGAGTTLSTAHYEAHLEDKGRTWVAELDGEIVGFAAISLPTARVWALFVHPDHEGEGIGRTLHDQLVGWLKENGYVEATLSTDPDTRASAFYEKAGWQRMGINEAGEAEYRFAL